ncbi:MAG: hypothetical protein QM784_37075 [Polyangiaceae bacterium]
MRHRERIKGLEEVSRGNKRSGAVVKGMERVVTHAPKTTSLHLECSGMDSEMEPREHNYDAMLSAGFNFSAPQLFVFSVRECRRAM